MWIYDYDPVAALCFTLSSRGVGWKLDSIDGVHIGSSEGHPEPLVTAWADGESLIVADSRGLANPRMFAASDVGLAVEEMVGRLPEDWGA